MPGKHVRFARTNTYHSIPTSSPAFSGSSLSSLPSSAGPVTPPNLPGPLPGPSPYILSLPPVVPKPPPVPRYLGPIRVHPLLVASHSPPINYDVSLPPSTITTHHHGLSSLALSEPATNPPLPSMTITTPYLPWTVVVTASSRGGFVTVSDVLNAIYHTLRANITPAEFQSLPSSKDKRRVSSAYEDRYKRIRSTRAYAEEKSQGVKRVDFLMGRTRFTGLSSTSRRPDVWVMNTS